MENEFEWNTSNTIQIIMFVIVFPVAMYNIIVNEIRAGDEVAGRPPRDFLWNHAKAGEKDSS